MDTIAEETKHIIVEYLPNSEGSLQQSVGKAIRMLRESKKLSQDDFGFPFGSTQSKVSYIERGMSNMHIKTLATIASSYNKRLVISFVSK